MFNHNASYALSILEDLIRLLNHHGIVFAIVLTVVEPNISIHLNLLTRRQSVSNFPPRSTRAESGDVSSWK